MDAVVVAIPNDLYCELVVRAAEAGKHIIIEKPLARTLDDADRMITACKKNRVKLMYVETIIFSPNYVWAKKLADEGAVGGVYLVKQGEKHDGPHTPWFYDVQRSGGGASILCRRPSAHGLGSARISTENGKGAGRRPQNSLDPRRREAENRAEESSGRGPAPKGFQGGMERSHA